MINMYNFSQERTHSLIQSAGQIKKEGATGAYKYQFESIEEKLDDVQNILVNANLTARDLLELEQVVNQLGLVLFSFLFYVSASQLRKIFYDMNNEKVVIDYL